MLRLPVARLARRGSNRIRKNLLLICAGCSTSKSDIHRPWIDVHEIYESVFHGACSGLNTVCQSMCIQLHAVNNRHYACTCLHNIFDDYF
jgi:hypothetical protein